MGFFLAAGVGLSTSVRADVRGDSWSKTKDGGKIRGGCSEHTKLQLIFQSAAEFPDFVLILGQAVPKLPGAILSLCVCLGGRHEGSSGVWENGVNWHSTSWEQRVWMWGKQRVSCAGGRRGFIPFSFE